MDFLDKRIAIKRTDGGVSILCPAPSMFDKASRDRISLDAMGIISLKATDEEVLEWIRQKDVPKGLESRIVDVNDIPEDRTFRNAWTDDKPTKTVDVDIEKAKEIKKDQLRELRKPILEKLDVEFMIAVEAGDTKEQEEIAKKKQELRDITSLELPSEVEKLKKFKPDCLRGE